MAQEQQIDYKKLYEDMVVRHNTILGLFRDVGLDLSAFARQQMIQGNPTPDPSSVNMNNLISSNRAKKD